MNSVTDHPSSLATESITSSTESATNTTNSPVITATPATTSGTIFPISTSKDFLTLTPVKINDLSSPIRPSTFDGPYPNQSQKTIFNTTSNSSSPYSDKFNVISKQLEKLLGDLHVFYQKIGYSNLDIQKKEEAIFSTLSESINNFYQDAQTEMENLSTSNDMEQEILNKILENLNDPNGIRTIPDLYIRNSILFETRKTVPQSPKKPLSLLNKKSLLESAKIFIFNAYIPKLISFLNNALNLQIIINSVGTIESMAEEDVQFINNIPKLYVIQACLKSLNETNEISQISNFIGSNKKLFLYSDQFKHLTPKRNERLAELTKYYGTEYDFRFCEVKKLIKNIETLLHELRLNATDNLNKDEIELLTKYSRIEKASENEYVPLNDDLLNKFKFIKKQYEIVKSQRFEEKKLLLDNCRELWCKLKVPEEYTSFFLNKNNNLSLDVIDNFKIEFQRLQTMKKELIKDLITESWEKINELWDTLQIPNEDRANFIGKFKNMKETSQGLQDDENLLEVCEVEIKNLNEQLKIYEPVLNLIKEFQSLQKDKIFLENSSKDSSRLLARNSHKILLKEENTRRRLKRHFPKVIKELKVKLVEAEDFFHKPFSFNGEKLQDIILKEEEEFMSRYPKSVLNFGRTRPVVNSTRVNDNHSRKHATIPKTTTMRSKTYSTAELMSRTVHKTPIRHKSDSMVRKEKISRSLSPSRSNNDNFVQFSTVQERKSMNLNNATRIRKPTLMKSYSEITSSTMSPTLALADMKFNDIRPKKLFPVDMNKLNRERNNTMHKSQIPKLSQINKTSTTQQHSQTNESKDAAIVDKENAYDGRLSSPYKEPDHSIYKLSMSPDGKFRLNIQQRDLDNPFDDTSIFEEDVSMPTQEQENYSSLPMNILPPPLQGEQDSAATEPMQPENSLIVEINS
ncbi:hypothetical protein KAFR_0C06170 [Kazachstania africana CBS 2517]|uniref:Anaphase spindle elongation protein n=1 Tax=Kazachstania africana (strain ATCC 22294 / BCRC 22015 / CBS 2517 / CECT 1963 / NBRC 1671 / NRRL Y-8276) TaxID=1071382 RepID=H2ATA9_KAZAF|nr:hypothetical protein KAFR_0C06170 [Kazachstania africana CBS 2517]CCF57609.1 hypothetical protein KAFR_0C06170 [Kazachstania africana CBS 2517]